MLKKRLEAAERDNRELKLSVYDLSARLSAALSQAGGRSAQAPDATFNALGASSFDPMAAGKSDALDGRLGSSLLDGHDPAQRSGHNEASSTPVDGRQFACSSTLSGHTGAVYSIAFSPNGRLLASGSFDKSVRCWAIDSGEEQGEALCLQKHTHNVSSLSWAADSRSLLSGSYDHTVRLWDLSTAVCERSWMVPNAAFVQGVAHHPTSASLFAAATTGHSLLVFDVRAPSDRPAAELPNGVMINSLLFLPRGDHILSGVSCLPFLLCRRPSLRLLCYRRLPAAASPAAASPRRCLPLPFRTGLPCATTALPVRSSQAARQTRLTLVMPHTYHGAPHLGQPTPLHSQHPPPPSRTWCA